MSRNVIVISLRDISEYQNRLSPQFNSMGNDQKLSMMRDLLDRRVCRRKAARSAGLNLSQLGADQLSVVKELKVVLDTILSSMLDDFDIVHGVSRYADAIGLHVKSVNSNLTVEEFKDYLAIKEAQGEVLDSDIYKEIDDFINNGQLLIADYYRET